MLKYGYNPQEGSQTQKIQLQRDWLTSVAKLTSQNVAEGIADWLPDSWTQKTLISQVKQQSFNGGSSGLQSIKHGNGVSTEWANKKTKSKNAVPLWVKVSAALNTQNNVGTQQIKVQTAKQKDAIKIDAFGRQTHYTPSTGQYAGKAQILQWNAANQLVAVLDANSQKTIASYQYGSTGNRISKTVYSQNNPPQTTYYAYDNAHRIIAESKGGTDVTRQYLYTDHRVHTVLEGSDIYAVSTDWRDLPQQVTDKNQQTVWSREFDAWGNFIPKKILKTPQRIKDLNIRLAGQYYDDETGLHYNIHRYLNPKTGRYISPDPLGTPDGNDRYAYLNGKPYGGIDPLGLFEIPVPALLGFDFNPLTNSLYLNDSDGGHADILRIAFAQFNAKEAAFSSDIINQIIVNNYHTDAMPPSVYTAAIGGAFGGGLGMLIGSQVGIVGGGQFNAANHIDNPNDGPMCVDKACSIRTASYANGNDFIQASLDQINSNRSKYTQVTRNGSKFDISTILSSFGQNSHTIADFYAHSNWVDSKSRGGCVENLVSSFNSPFGGSNEKYVDLLNKQNTDNLYYYDLTEGGKVGKYEIGYVPTGLERIEVWDETVAADLYTGTVKLISDVKGCISDINCSQDKTSHGYWNKDHDGLTPDEEPVDGVALAEKGLFAWSVQFYDHKNPPQKVIQNIPNQETDGVLGVDYFTDTGLLPKQGDRIYVSELINNAHELAIQLAVKHTVSEIQKLYDLSASVNVGNKTLQEIFASSANLSSIEYKKLPSKQ